MPSIKREPIRWPNQATPAFWVCLNIEYLHIDKPIRGSRNTYIPDVQGYSLRDYGARVGVYRLMEVLDKHRMRASVLLNADVCKYHPTIIEEGNKRNREWLGHGETHSRDMSAYPRVKSAKSSRKFAKQSRKRPASRSKAGSALNRHSVMDDGE